VLRFGRDRAPGGTWKRVLHVIQRPGAPCLPPVLPLASQTAAVSAAVASAHAMSGRATAPATVKKRLT
jgi:hypothetical protein